MVDYDILNPFMKMENGGTREFRLPNQHTG